MGQKSIRVIWLAVYAGVFGAGCGGGQSGASTGTGSHTATSNGLSFTYSGQPKPLLSTSSGSVSVLGQAGATFNNVTLEPAPSLGSTYLVVARGVGTYVQLYKSSYTSIGSEQLLLESNGDDSLPGISAYGLISFTKNGFDGSQMYSVRADGTGLTPITFTDGGLYPDGTHYSTDGTNRLSFLSGSGLFVGPSTGGTASIVQSNATVGGYACWSPSGTSLAYCVNTATTGNNDVYTTPSGGGTATDVTPTILRNTGAVYPMGWSSDGVTILADYRPSGGLAEVITFPVNDPTEYAVITPSGNEDYQACFSPDGSMIALERNSDGGATSGVYLCDTAGVNQRLAISDPTGTDADLGIAWSPFLPKETVVAASGSTFYHKASSGFLLTQNGAQFGSFVAFTANTPATAAIQAPPSPTEDAPLIFTITADSITQIGYINGYFSSGTTLTLSSTPTVVVSVDSFTGQIDLIAPAAAAKPITSKNADGTLTCSAPFKGLYDGNGHNLAPSGASKLVLNPKTGQLVSFS